MQDVEQEEDEIYHEMRTTIARDTSLVRERTQIPISFTFLLTFYTDLQRIARVSLLH
jgi:hypothetical protein